MPVQDRRHAPVGRSLAMGRSRPEYHSRPRPPMAVQHFTVLRRSNPPITCSIHNKVGVRWQFVAGYTAERFLRAWLVHRRRMSSNRWSRVRACGAAPWGKRYEGNDWGIRAVRRTVGNNPGRSGAALRSFGLAGQRELERYESFLVSGGCHCRRQNVVDSCGLGALSRGRGRSNSVLRSGTENGYRPN